jgi:hypothetical protein
MPKPPEYSRPFYARVQLLKPVRISIIPNPIFNYDWDDIGNPVTVY